MKYLNRLLYAMVAALGILIVFNITDSTVKSKELTARAETALSENNYDYFVSVRFFQTEPIEDIVVSSGDATYHVLIYDAAYIRMVEEEFDIVDGFVWLMFQTSGTSIDPYFDIRYLNGTDLLKTQLGFQVFEFPVYSGMDQQSTATLVKKSDFVTANPEAFTEITSIELWVGDEQRLTIPVSITIDDFTTKAAIADYIALNNDAPNASFGTVTMSPVIVIDSSGPAVRNILFYVALVAILTFVLFKAREKRLGRKTPTIGVQQDIEKLHAPKIDPKP